MAKKMSAKEYIAQNDFEGCNERYEHATKNWKPHWLETLHTIFNASKEWAKKYVFDPIAKLYVRIGAKVRSVTQSESTELAPAADNGVPSETGCGAYVVEHYRNGERVWLKIGKAKNLRVRMRNQLNDYRKKGQANSVRVLKFYPFQNANAALSMENHLRDHFQQIPGSGYVAQDRFTNAFWTSEDEAAMNEKYKETLLSFA